jgi:hypothetical protein
MLGKQRVIVGIRASSQDELGLIGGLVVDRAEVRLDDDDLVTSQFDGKKRVRLLQGQSPSHISSSKSPHRFWFADNRHIARSGGASDVDSFALSDLRLCIIRREVHDPAIIRGSAIVVALRRQGWDRKANHKSSHKEILSHWPETFL